MENGKLNFRFKDLLLWQRSMDFANKIMEIAENLNTSNKHYCLVEQIESSSASVSQNMAEGKYRGRKWNSFNYCI